MLCSLSEEKRLNSCRVIKIILTTMSAGLPVVTLPDSDIPGAHLDEPCDNTQLLCFDGGCSVDTDGMGHKKFPFFVN